MRIAAMTAGFSLLLLALPVAAQQAAPNPQTSPSAAAPPQQSGPAAMMSTKGRGGAGMMTGSSAMGGMDEDDDNADAAPMRRWHHRHEGRGTPMQIIINIGPDNRVETGETHERGPDGIGPASPRWRMMGGEWGGHAMAERVGEHLDYLHDQLQLTPEQQPAWDRFASAVREAAAQTRPGPAAMAQGQSLEQRLATHETMLNSRLEVIRAIRGALSGLTGSLSEAQKQTLDQDSAVLMRGASRMRGW
jgi:hypothetical protein